MVPVSETVLKALNSNGRTFFAQMVFDNGDILADKIKTIDYTAGCVSGQSITIGSTVAAQLEIELDTPEVALSNRYFTLELGIKTDNGVEYTAMGHFLVYEVNEQDGAVSMKAYDAMIYAFEQAYFPSSGVSTSKAVLQDICEQTGVSGDFSGLETVSVSISSGNTYREIIGYMAALHGANAVIDRSGALVLRWFTDSGAGVGPDRYYQGGFTHENANFTVNTIECTVESTGTDEEGYSSSSSETLTAGGGTTGIFISNNYMTQDRLDAIYKKLGGFSYRLGDVEFFGDFRFEPGDIITVTGLDGVNYTLPITEVTLSFDGGLTTTVTAVGESESKQSASASGPVTESVQRLTSELGLFKTVYVTSLSAINADIQTLYAGQASIDELEATVANIQTLLAGTAGVDVLEAIHLTAANTVIDDAIISDAMIANLSADKIVAGTIYTSIVKIASDEDENLLIDGSTIQITDTNGTVRIQVGKDGEGDYSMYIWDADGVLLWQPTGITGEGIGSGTIKDVNVADNAAIQGSKLDIKSVASSLNESGELVVDAANITIDETTLSVAYKTIVKATEDAQNAADAAQKAAGTKRRGFVTTPTPPYDVGDLWADGTNIWTCTTARSSGVFEASDWQILNAYANQEDLDNVASIASDAVVSVEVLYARGTSSVTVPPSGWSTVAPEWVDGTYMWQKTVTTYGDGSTATSAATCLTGATGAKGETGAAGADGTGVSSILEQYYQSSSSTTQAGGSWSATVPTWKNGYYVWTRSVITYTDGSIVTTSPVCVTGAKGSTGSTGATGATGAAGADGVGIESVDVWYYLSTSSSTLTGGTWSTTAPTWKNGYYMWSKTITTYTDGTSNESDAVCITGAKGETGAAGADGIGVSITSKAVAYQLSASGTTTPTGTWSSSIPALTQGKFLWTRTIVTYSTGDSTTSYSVSYIAVDGEDGADGTDGTSVTIKSTSITYQLGSSGTTAPTGTWSSSVPALTQGKYLWTKTIVTYSDETSTTSYSIAYIAEDGAAGVDGTSFAWNYVLDSATEKSATRSSGNVFIAYDIADDFYELTDTQFVLSVDLKGENMSSDFAVDIYLRSSSGKISTTPYELGWVPGTEYSRFSTVVTFRSGYTLSDIASVRVRVYAGTGTLYAKNVKVEAGNTASAWTPAESEIYGETGVGIKSITEYYLVTSSSSGVTTGTSGWTTTVQTVTSSKKYLWNYEVVTLTDNSTTTTSPVIIGVYGDTGATGATGAKGDTGVGISGITEYYAVSESNSTAPASWSESVQTMTSTNKYLWNYEKVTYTDGSSTTTTPAVIGVYGDTPSTYTAILTDTALPAGTCELTFYIDGEVAAISAYADVYYINSSGAWARSSGNSGTFTGTKTWTHNVAYGYKVDIYNSSAKAKLLASTTCIIGSTGDTGASFAWNMLRYTRDMPSGASVYTTHSASFTYEQDNEGFTFVTIPADGSYHAQSFYLPDNSIEDIEGQNAVITAYVKSDGLAAYSAGFQMCAGVFTAGNTRRRYLSLSNFDNSKYNTDDYVDGEWVRLVWRGTLPLVSAMTEASSTEDYVKYGIQVYVNSNNSLYPLSIKKMKLVLGSEATEWAPHPDDIIGADGKDGTDGKDGENGKMLHGTSSTAASTATKVVTCTDATELYAGLTVCVTFSTANTAASPTLNVNSLGAKSIYINGAAASSSNYFLWGAGAIIQFMYNGTYWIPLGHPCSYYGTSSTAAATVAKTSSISGAVVTKGTTVSVKFTYANTVDSPTLNISSTGAKSIYGGGAVMTADGDYNWAAGSTVTFVFNGTLWAISDDSTYTKIHTITEHISTLETDLSVVQGQISSKVWQTDIDSTVTEAIEGLAVGGRNLLALSRCARTAAYTTKGITVSAPDSDGWFTVSGTTVSMTAAVTIPLWYNPTGNNYNEKIEGLPDAGETITITVEVDGNPFVEGTKYTDCTYICMYGTSSNESIRRGGYAQLTYTGAPSFYLSRIAYYIGAAVPEGQEVNGRFRIKIERGTFSTDWSPAPEDLYESIQTVSDQYATLTQTINGITTEVGDIQTTLSTKADSSAVTSLSSKVSTLEQTAASITSSVSSVQTQLDSLDINGRNLAIGTSDEWKTWTVTDGTNKTAYPWKLKDMNDRLDIKEGDIIHVSLDIKFSDDFAATGTSTAGLYLQGNKNYGGTWTTITVTGGNQSSAIKTVLNSDLMEGHISTYFKVTSDMIDGTYSGTWQIGFRANYYAGTLYYRNAMANKGTVEQMWSPAPEDTESSITAVETRVTTVEQTVDSFSVTYTKNGEVRSQFALEEDSITISAGTITFASDTLVIDSENCTLASNGLMEVWGLRTRGIAEIPTTSELGYSSFSTYIPYKTWHLNGYYYVAAKSSGGVHRLYRKTDTSTSGFSAWTGSITITSLLDEVVDMTYGNGYFCIIGYLGGYLKAYYRQASYLSSTTWTEISGYLIDKSYSSYSFHNVVYGADGNWVITGTGDSSSTIYIMYASSTPVSFSYTSISASKNIYGLAYGNGYWLLTYSVSGSGVYLCYATAPSSWSTKRIATASFLTGSISGGVRDVKFINGYFMLGVGTSQNTYYAGIMYAATPTGNWKVKTLWFDTGNYGAVVWKIASFNNTLVAVGQRGECNYVAYSENGIDGDWICGYAWDIGFGGYVQDIAFGQLGCLLGGYYYEPTSLTECNTTYKLVQLDMALTQPLVGVA